VMPDIFERGKELGEKLLERLEDIKQKNIKLRESTSEIPTEFDMSQLLERLQTTY